MTTTESARAVLRSIGGRENVVANGLCMTRLRITVANPTLVDRDSLVDTPGVLGIAKRGPNGLEVVFGPRTVRGVFDEFSRLTGLEPTIEIPPMAAPAGKRGIDVRIAHGEAPSSDIEELASAIDRTEAPGHADDRGGADERGSAPKGSDDMAELERMLADVDDPDCDASGDTVAAEAAGGAEDGDPDPCGPRLLVINGPNINMLGIREPDLYGKSDFNALLELCHKTAREAGFSHCECYQSNHEGDIVDRIQDAYQDIDGIVINPGAYTHTSVAILDALKSVSIPAVEVHISKVNEREDFRQVSYVRLACFETVMGLGIQGYAKAIRDLAARLDA